MLSPDRTALQMVSLVRATGEIEVSLAPVVVPVPGPDEVVVRVEAAPINPSDLLLLLPAVDPASLRAAGPTERRTLTARARTVEPLAGRLDQPVPVGNEGAGVVVEAGSSPAAQALVGKVVSLATGGGMYAQYRCAHVAQCIALDAGATAVDGASAFINPLTALGFLETMRREGHTALVNTAAASNLGVMLVRICQRDGVGLVNVVRRPEQAAMLRELGAIHVCDSSSPSFVAELTDAIAATHATLAFDAIGGGPLVNQILRAMEGAIARKTKTYSRYGSPVHKQVYVYGGLDLRPTELDRSYGLAWGVGGWLMTPKLQSFGGATVAAMKARVAAELTTTFASAHARRVTLEEALDPAIAADYLKRATGAKVLICP